MQRNNAPPKVSVPFARDGVKNTIPIPSQENVTPGAASFTTGFPPLTRTPITQGGVPPYGEDFNGIFYSVTAFQQYQSAGGQFTYDSAFSTAIGGYPKGALLMKSSLNGFWRSTVDNNTTDPDSASSAGWVDFIVSATPKRRALRYFFGAGM